MSRHSNESWKVSGEPHSASSGCEPPGSRKGDGRPRQTAVVSSRAVSVRPLMHSTRHCKLTQYSQHHVCQALARSHSHTLVHVKESDRLLLKGRQRQCMCICASGVCVCVHNAEEVPGERAHEQRKGANSIMQIPAH